MKLDTATLKLRPAPERGFLEMTLPSALHSFDLTIAGIPGVAFKRNVWLVPEELEPLVVEMGLKTGLRPLRVYSPPPSYGEINPKLHPYQQEAVAHALAAESWLLNFEMGLGKTPTAIETLRLADAWPAVIVCPALVRQNWLDELNRWWPDHPEAEIIDTGMKALSSQADIRITSYELLGKLSKHSYSRSIEGIVLDESHMAANMGASRTQTVEYLRKAWPDSYRLALTATPITNEPKGLHNQLDVLWPGRFGSWFQFVSRYCDKQEAIYSRSGFKPVGLNAAAAAELRMRLASCSSRVTKLEVAHLLPPFQVQCLRVPPRDRGFNPRELLERFVRMDKHANNPDALIRAAGEQKVGHALEQVRLALTSGNPRVAVLTHLKSTAHEIAAVLQQEGIVVQHVDGDVPIAKRIKLLKQAAELPTCVLVTTMHAVNVGIDLTPFNVAVFAELDYTPANVIQALGRFSRLSGKLPATCYLIVLAGTQDEIIAQRVQQKTRDINAVIAAGDSEKKVQEALDPKVEEAAFWEELREAASQQLEGAYV